MISFASRTLSPAEKNYHSNRLEFLALKWAITEKFADYLKYGPLFIVYTDNNPLTYVNSSAKLNAVGLRWVADLAEFSFSLKYRPGKQNNDADYLSRHPFGPGLVAEYTKKLSSDTVKTMLDNSTNPVCSCVSRQVDVCALLLCPDVDMLSVSNEILSYKQQEDPVIGPVFQSVKSGVPFVDKGQNKASKILNKLRSNLSIINDVLYLSAEENTKLILPAIYTNTVLIELHDKMGHLGLDRVLELAKHR